MKETHMRNINNAALILFIMAVAGHAVPAFPGAQGGGAGAKGGRGGRVIQVTNLNSSGAGSLREALQATGPRIIVFRVGGTIDLQGGDINVYNPFVTIAGQTAPGGGVCIKGKIDLWTHEVIMQYVRIRPGRLPDDGPVQCIFVRNSAYNIIVDHCSLSWATDECFTAYSTNSPTSNITLSWSFIGEGLSGSGYNKHASGPTIGSTATADKFTNVSVHHNFMQHNQHRSPYIKIKNAEVINNISYDWEHWCSMYSGAIHLDLIGNRYVKGTSFGGQKWQQDHGIIFRTRAGDNGNYGAPGDPTIFITGNYDQKYHTDPDSDNWGMIEAVDGSFNRLGDLNKRFRRSSRQTFSSHPVTVHHVEEVEDMILSHAGAFHRLDDEGAWVDCRDAVDKRLVRQYRNGTGRIIDNPRDVGGWPSFPKGTSYPDADKDGMSDVWEKNHGLDPSNAKDRNHDADRDGFTNLDEFLAGTNPGGGKTACGQHGIIAVNTKNRPAAKREITCIPGIRQIKTGSAGVFLFHVNGQLIPSLKNHAHRHMIVE